LKKIPGLVVIAVMAVACSSPAPLTATVTAAASTAETVGGAAQLVVNVTNTGPGIPHLGLVFRTHDVWFQTHQMTSLGGCTISVSMSAFDCGDLAAGQAQSYSFSGAATSAGSFHYELAMRDLVQPFDYVNEHSDGPDVQAWDEQVTAA